MAKRCPNRNGRPVIYLDCAECEDKKRCREKSRKDFKKIILNSKISKP